MVAGGDAATDVASPVAVVTDAGRAVDSDDGDRETPSVGKLSFAAVSAAGFVTSVDFSPSPRVTPDIVSLAAGEAELVATTISEVAVILAVVVSSDF